MDKATTFSDLDLDLQKTIAQLYLDQMTVRDCESYTYEQTCDLHSINRAFRQVTKPWIAEWHDLFENPAEFGDWTRLTHANVLVESPYDIGDEHIITTEEIDDTMQYDFYYDGHCLGEFDCTDGDDTWKLFVGHAVIVKDVFSFTPDSRTILLYGGEEEINTMYIAKCKIEINGEDNDDGFLVPPLAIASNVP